MTVKQFFEIFRTRSNKALDPRNGCIWIHIIRNGQDYMTNKNTHNFDNYKIIKIVTYGDLDGDINFDIYINDKGVKINPDFILNVGFKNEVEQDTGGYFSPWGFIGKK